jgi:hypothetical protein
MSLPLEALVLVRKVLIVCRGVAVHSNSATVVSYHRLTHSFRRIYCFLCSLALTEVKCVALTARKMKKHRVSYFRYKRFYDAGKMLLVVPKLR